MILNQNKDSEEGYQFSVVGKSGRRMSSASQLVKRCDRGAKNYLVYNMACLGTGRLCAGVEKLCNFWIRGTVCRKSLPVFNNSDVSFSTFQTTQVRNGQFLTFRHHDTLT